MNKVSDFYRYKQKLFFCAIAMIIFYFFNPSLLKADCFSILLFDPFKADSRSAAVAEQILTSAPGFYFLKKESSKQDVYFLSGKFSDIDQYQQVINKISSVLQKHIPQGGPRLLLRLLPIKNNCSQILSFNSSDSFNQTSNSDDVFDMDIDFVDNHDESTGVNDDDIGKTTHIESNADINVEVDNKNKKNREDYFEKVNDNYSQYLSEYRSYCNDQRKEQLINYCADHVPYRFSIFTFKDEPIYNQVKLVYDVINKNDKRKYLYIYCDYNRHTKMVTEAYLVLCQENYPIEFFGRDELFCGGALTKKGWLDKYDEGKSRMVLECKESVLLRAM